MSDERLRRIEREAPAGDVETKAFALAERLRMGLIDKDRVRLAAYCGSEAAIAVVGELLPRCTEGTHKRVGKRTLVKTGIEPCGAGEWDPCPRKCDGGIDRSFAGWTRALAGFGQTVLARAALAAGRAAASEWIRPHLAGWNGNYGSPEGYEEAIRALDACAACLVDSSEANRLACWRVTAEMSDGFIPSRMAGFADLAFGMVRPDEKYDGLVRAVAEFARLAGEGPMRAAVQAALVEWALARTDI